MTNDQFPSLKAATKRWEEIAERENASLDLSALSMSTASNIAIAYFMWKLFKPTESSQLHPTPSKSQNVGIENENPEKHYVHRPSTPTILASLSALSYAIKLNYDQAIPRFGQNSSMKPFVTFQSFYDVAYLGAHVEPKSRLMHLAIFMSIFAGALSDSRLFISWMNTMTAGLLATRPLLHLDTPWLESMVMTAAGMSTAAHYSVLPSYFMLYSTWLSWDFLDHVLLGNNGGSALLVGKHYLSWGLLGQAKLAITVTRELWQGLN